MRKKFGIGLFLLIIFSLIIIPKKTSKAATPPGKIEAQIRSYKALSFSDLKTNETIIIDSDDFRYLAEKLDQMNKEFGR